MNEITFECNAISRFFNDILDEIVELYGIFIMNIIDEFGREFSDQYDQDSDIESDIESQETIQEYEDEDEKYLINSIIIHWVPQIIRIYIIYIGIIIHIS